MGIGGPNLKNFSETLALSVSRGDHRPYFRGRVTLKPWLITYESRYVTPAGGVICQKDIARTDTQLASIADLDLTLPG